MIKVYDRDLNLVAFLENAFAIGYEKRLNELWTASFSLPANDPKNAECLPYRYVEIFDGTDRVDLFRIIPTKTGRNDSGIVKDYQCEHVLATLLDDVLFRYHERLGLPTTSVLSYILSQQDEVRWQLGTVEITRTFDYKWENDNLLAAVFSIPKPFDVEYIWTWDTSTYPWTLNLVEPESEVQTYIRYRKNLRGITKTEDPTNLCTRLYVLGYGEGVNQLGIETVNPTGQPYIDADTQAQYGVIARVWTDRRYESTETLFNAGKSLLDEMKLPHITYSLEAADIYQVTKDSVDKFVLGTVVRAIDDELGIDIQTRVVGLDKSDVMGAPGDIKITISNNVIDLGNTISSLAERQKINETYAQGATNLDSHDYEDNCDADNPTVIKFYLPEETARINKMLLSFETLAFRAYSKGNEAKEVEVITSEADEQKLLTSDVGSWSLSDAQYLPGDFMNTNGDHDHYYSDSWTDGSTSGYTSTDGDHVHSMYSVSHDHELTIPAHDHDVTIPSHTHEIIYGIYNGPTPTAVSIEVDGNPVPGSATSGTDIDLVPYLSKDGEGRINRGTWHEIAITPNNLGRIRANVVIQLFVQSRGGGDY